METESADRLEGEEEQQESWFVKKKKTLTGSYVSNKWDNTMSIYYKMFSKKLGVF